MRRSPRPPDLTYLRQIGTRGRGYDVDQQAALINETLGTNSLQPVVLIGVGNLGAALLRYRGFGEEGFRIVATTVPGRAGLALNLVWGRKRRYFRFKVEDSGALTTKGQVSSPTCRPRSAVVRPVSSRPYGLRR